LVDVLAKTKTILPVDKPHFASTSARLSLATTLL